MTYDEFLTKANKTIISNILDSIKIFYKGMVNFHEAEDLNALTEA